MVCSGEDATHTCCALTPRCASTPRCAPAGKGGLAGPGPHPAATSGAQGATVRAVHPAAARGTGTQGGGVGRGRAGLAGVAEGGGAIGTCRGRTGVCLIN